MLIKIKIITKNKSESNIIFQNLFVVNYEYFKILSTV
jgi:hypothetical protein